MRFCGFEVVLSTAGKYWDFKSHRKHHLLEQVCIDTFKTVLLGLARVQVQSPSHYGFPSVEAQCNCVPGK